MNEGKNKKKITLTNFTEIVTVAYLLCFFVLEPILLLTKHRHLLPITIIGTLFALVFIILDRVVRKFEELEQKLNNNSKSNKTKKNTTKKSNKQTKES